MNTTILLTIYAVSPAKKKFTTSGKKKSQMNLLNVPFDASSCSACPVAEPQQPSANQKEHIEDFQKMWQHGILVYLTYKKFQTD